MISGPLQPIEQQPGRAWLQYGGLLALFLAIIATGYLGFRAFASIADLTAFNLYFLATVAGVASFFSPCAFPLLPAYLSFYYVAREGEGGSLPSSSRALPLGLAATLGVITFNLILGVLIALLGTGLGRALSISASDPSQFVRVLRGGVGALLLVLGAGQLVGWNLKPPLMEALSFHTRPQREGTRTPAAGLYLYGLGYCAAGMGCTGPTLAGLMSLALASGRWVSSLTAFIVFSLTMGGLMLLVSGLVAASRQTFVTRLRAAAPRIKSSAGTILILVGAFNMFTSLNLDPFLRLFFG